MESLSQLLHEAIQSKRVTVTQLAAACGCSRQYIYQILNGEHQPTLPLAEKIANALGAELTVKTRKSKKLTA